jgi:glycosyltransferase involved in cell wall biosynthesis
VKLLFISDVPFENPVSGSEQVLHHQAKELVRQGMRVYAITRRSNGTSWGVRNISGVCEGSYQASAQERLRFLHALMKYPFMLYNRFNQNGPFQAFVCHQPFNCFALLMLRRLKRVPLLYVFHSPSNEEFLLLHENRGDLRNLIPNTVRFIIENLCLKRALKVMVLSRYMKQKVQKIHRIAADHIIVNPGGVDLERFKPSKKRHELKKQLGLPDGKIHLLTVRNLEPRMGLDNLLQAILFIKNQQMSIHLTLGGDGIEKKKLKDLILKNGLNKEVTLTGFIQPELLPKYYAASDFFVLPTRRLEGFGLITPESLACGTPVLGTPVGGTKEILSSFKPELLFIDHSAEAMANGIQIAVQKYFSDQKKYDQLRKSCRLHAKSNYSWERHVNQLTSIINDIQYKMPIDGAH